ncbi:protein RRP5 homolog [Topomyia yanbarensis]|uniref:protein RRP5 homolog n=1 Tax=Topomyia yanbarensis TaxID=2498891 RepID=UPI00273C7A46|nr:protein RRP5 homolog [Topomyia yanbarensis]XP_058825045.1 protein RRP5 homolog [Topomyia yanbarensis]
MVYVEPTFPRGRKADTAEDNIPRKKVKKNARQEYGASTTNEEKPQKPRQKERQQHRLEQMEQDKEVLDQGVRATSLQFKTAQVGMLVMGCVYKVQKMDLTISLPGRLFGTVPLMGISEAYNNRLHCLVQKSDDAKEERCPGIDELYEPGDLVYVRIKEKQEYDKRFQLTLNPKELHSDFSHKHLVEGLVLSATIEAEEDHGYQMDVGIKHVRAFLPTANVRKNKTEIGANLYCSIEKVTQTNVSATIILKAFKPNEPRKLAIDNANIDSIVPGSVVTFTVGSVLSNGLQGTLFDDTVSAFVNENMLEKPLSRLNNYELFRQIQGRILYVMPMSKHIFLTLANFDGNKTIVSDPVAPGTIVEDARVLNKGPSGVWFQISKKHKAFLPRHIIRSKHNENYDEQIIMAKYQVNSLHKVRVVRYEAFDRTIIVTDDDKMIDIKYFSVSDLKVGEIYDCRVNKVLDSKRGYTVTLDNVKGLLTSYNFIHRKALTANQSVRLRLISIEEDRRLAQFSNHPEYLKKSARLITDPNSIIVGQSYHGTVISEQDKFFVVAFCNKITGILFKFCRQIAQDQDKIECLKPGSVGSFTVHEVAENGKKITLSIPLNAGKEKLGNITTATVTGVYATGSEIYLVKENETGTILPEAYSDFPAHNLIFQNLLKEGEKLQVVNINSDRYSYRDVYYFRRKPTQVKDVKIGQILRAYCVEVLPKRKKVSLRLALKDYSRKVLLRMSEFTTARPAIGMEDGQVVLVKVIGRIPKEDGLLLRVSAKLADVCTQGVDEVLRYMHSYLVDVERLLERFKSRDKAFARYTVGQTVTCIVEGFVDDADEQTMIVQLTDSNESIVKGIASKDPKHGNYLVGDQLEGRVVWVDIERQLVNVCVVKKHLKHVVDADTWEPSSELLDVDSPQDFVTLFKNDQVAVGCLRKVDCPLVIVPLKCHYNDFDPVDIAPKTRVVLMRKGNGSLHAVTAESYEKFKDLKGSETIIRKKEFKHCWLPDDYEEPLLEEPLSEKDKEQSHSDSGIDKDDETVDNTITVKSTKKSKKKLQKPVKEKLLKAKSVASPGKILKLDSKKKTKSAAKKLREKMPLIISQLDGAEDFPRFKESKSNKGKSHKSFFGSRPAAKASNTASSQSGTKQVQKQPNGHLEKKDKLHQLAQQTKFKKKNKLKISGEAGANVVLEKLPGPSNFWSSKPTVDEPSNSDSSDEEMQMETIPKKRSTAKERFDAMKQEEKRIRQIEEELADASVDPHTPDQFDRLALAQPNSSLLWIRYMVFHMESAEIEKARAVARKALKTINFREEAERLNVWIALLNLELRYETIESFKEVLQEAIQYNDSYKVYSRVIVILIECGKVPEVLELIDTLQKRFRKQSEMWLLIADCYYKIGYTSKVKPLLSKALKSLENKEHIPLIVKFAFLHNRNGDRDEAHLLFEQILTSYPKRTDIWSQYVDMLVKDGLIEAARQTLDRAIIQRLPMRNMKTLYTKYVAFEEKHGNQESVKKVKQMAADYVKQQLKASGVVAN